VYNTWVKTNQGAINADQKGVLTTINRKQAHVFKKTVRSLSGSRLPLKTEMTRKVLQDVTPKRTRGQGAQVAKETNYGIRPKLCKKRKKTSKHLLG